MDSSSNLCLLNRKYFQNVSITMPMSTSQVTDKTTIYFFDLMVTRNEIYLPAYWQVYLQVCKRPPFEE